MEPPDSRFIGQRGGDYVHQAPPVALAGLFPVLRKNWEAVPGENAVAVALLLPVVHVAEERIGLRPDVEVDAGYILVFVKHVRILEVDLLLVAESVVIGGVSEASLITGSEVLDHRSILAVELRGGDNVPCE